MPADDPFTTLLRRAAADPNAIDALLAAPYDELRQGQLRQSWRHRSAHHLPRNFRCHSLERRVLLTAIRWEAPLLGTFTGIGTTRLCAPTGGGVSCNFQPGAA